MLSTCFLKKGMPSSAVRYCQTGLSVADISSHEAMALRYDMGVAHSMAGSEVLELFAREASKGRAIDELRRELGVATCVFVGDDITDEAAFAAMRPGDVTIKVGDADTIAAHRLRGPDDVLRFIEQLVATAGEPTGTVG